MKKIKYSNFESMKDIINQLDLKYDATIETNKQKFFDQWENIVGKKLSSVSKPIEINKNSVLVVACKNSFIANELFLAKNNFIELIEDKSKELGLEIRDLRFEYKNWNSNK